MAGPLAVVGLTGLALVLSVGLLFGPWRDFLVSFSHPWNPLRPLGRLLSCPLSCGFVVGFLAQVLVGASPWWQAILWGGLIGGVSLAASQLVVMISRVNDRIMLGNVEERVGHIPAEVVLSKIKKLRYERQVERARKRLLHGEPLTEEDSDILAANSEKFSDAVMGVSEN